LAIGALAIGRLVVGRMAVGKLSVGGTRLRRLEIDELVVRHLTAPGLEALKHRSAEPSKLHLPRGWRVRR